MINFIAVSDLRCHYSGKDGTVADTYDLEKIKKILNHADGSTSFIVDIGDSICGSDSPEQSRELFSSIIDTYTNAPVTFHILMGERDHVIGKENFLSSSGYAIRYRAFDTHDYRCIFLDTYDRETGRFKVDDEQFAWLSRLLGKSHRPAIIFSHAPLRLTDESNEKDLVENRAALCEMIEKSNKVSLVISGHVETQDKVVSHGVPYITLAPAYGSGEPSFAKIFVSSAGTRIDGFGVQQSHLLENISVVSNTFINRIKRFFKTK